MKLKTNYNLTDEQTRTALIKRIQSCIEFSYPDFEAYMPNDGDWTYWKLDTGNNWSVKFFPEEPNSFEISYRYGSEPARKLGEWLAWRLQLEIDNVLLWNK